MAAALRKTAEKDAPQDPPQPESAIDATPPGPRKVTIVVENATLDVRVSGDERDDEEKTLRPFGEMDKESLLVLYHAIRAEVACK